MLPANLVLRDDNLGGRRFGVRNRMRKQADTSDHSPGFARLAHEVRRVPDDGFALGNLRTGSNACHTSRFRIVQNFVDLFVKHIRPTVNGAQPRESLRQLAQAVERIDIRCETITLNGTHVQPNAMKRVDSRLGQVTMIMERSAIEKRKK